MSDFGQSTYSTFIQALNIMNGALESHRDSILFKPMLMACDSIVGSENIGVAILADDAEQPIDYFTIRMVDGTFVLVDHGKPNADAAWKVSASYLETVAAHPARYIENPALLSFDWLKDRAGLTADPTSVES